MEYVDDGSCWIGVDPGGKDSFGIAGVREDGSVVGTRVVSCADEAAACVRFAPLGIGVDSPLWWSSGRSSDRKADQWIRRTYRISAGTVQTINSLRGAALAQGQMFAQRLRERHPGTRVTEAHPKAVAMALGGWESDAVRRLVGGVRNGEHERDAIMAAVAAREGFAGRWTCDLAKMRHDAEQDPATYWLGPVHYFWPHPS